MKMKFSKNTFKVFLTSFLIGILWNAFYFDFNPSYQSFSLNY